MNRRNVDMLHGSIVKGLLLLTLPIMVMNVTQILFNIIDMAILKVYSDDIAVGAVGACGTLTVLCTSLPIGISVGVNIIVARRVGAGERERADRVAMTSVLFSIVSGILLMIIGLVFAEDFLKMTNCHESLLPQATLYFRIFFYGMPFLMLYNFSAAILRAIGDTKRPMYYLVFGGILKILITFLFIKTFKMNVTGVAIATVISNIVACVMAFYTLIKGQDAVRIRFKQIKFDTKGLKEILYVGVPAGVQSALYSFANVVIATAVNGFGPDATTGVSIANQFDSVLYQISLAPSLAVTPYVAQNIGSGNIKRVKQTFVRAILITTAFGATFGFLSAIFSAQLSAIMSSTPAVIAYSRQKMIIVSSTYFICGINDVLCGTLRGMGRPIAPTVSTLVYMCLLRFIWVYFVFPYYPNLTFLYAVWPLGWTLSILSLLFIYFPSISKLQKRQVNL